MLLEGLRCAACSWLADKALSLQSGVLDVSVNPATARARLVWDPARVRLGDLLRVLEHVGLRPHPLAGEPSEQLALLERRTALKRLAVAGFGNMQVMMFAVPLYFGDAGGMDPAMREYMRLVSMLVSIPVALYAGWPFYQGAWHALRARSISMDVPVSLGIVLAFVASVWNALRGHGEVYFDSVTMFVFFLGLGRYIEMIARHRAGSVADALARLAPVTARRLRGGQAEDVQAVELAVGDELLVRTGEVFAADGVVIDGDGRVDESMLTGESAAIAKPPGALVHQGTQNLARPAQGAGGRSRGNTVLSGIVALLERAQAERPRLAKAADHAAAWFLSRILVGAAIVFAVWWYVDPSRAFSATLAVLVVTCPCALSLATPTALAAATAALARRGVLVAHTDAIESAVEGDARAVGQDRHADQGAGPGRGGAAARGALDGAGARLGRSTRADVASIRSPGRSSPPASRWPPRAASRSTRAAASRDGSTGAGCGSARARSPRSCRPIQAGGPPSASVPGGDAAEESWVYLGGEQGLLAAFRLTDPLRPEARDCVAGLAALGLRSEIASGDEAATVARVAARCGIDTHAARLAPADKLARLKQLQAEGAVVVAVGDGINDAPLLRGADVAIAMGRGSALAQTSADLILVRDSLEDLPRHGTARAPHATRHPPEPRLVHRLQPRGAAARGARLRAAVARGDRHVAELGRRRAERDAAVARLAAPPPPRVARDPAAGGRLTWKSCTC